jgi:hypothetical protein
MTGRQFVSPDEMRVVILAPTGKDAVLIHDARISACGSKASRCGMKESCPAMS